MQLKGYKMNISIFDIIGPIMIGPSSSHTAGAAKLSKIAVAIINKPIIKIEFGLYGSFFKTGLGHGTDKALLAGAMGFSHDDERIKDIYNIVKDRGIQFSFYEADLGDVHENSCKITLYHPDNTINEIIACSIGGGRILVNEINGNKLDITAEQPTLIIRHKDKKGVINSITNLLTQEDINIGIMKLTREEKGKDAATIIELDDDISNDLLTKIQNLNNIIDARLIKAER